MRKILLVFIFLFSACVPGAEASDWLGMNFFFELGYTPNGSFVMYDENKVKDRADIDYNMYADLDVNIWLFGRLYLGGNVKTDFWRTRDGYDFMPNKMTYGFKTGLDLKNLEIGFRHYCMHPIYVYMTQTEYENNYDPLWEGAYQEVFVRFKGNIIGKENPSVR